MTEKRKCERSKQLENSADFSQWLFERQKIVVTPERDRGNHRANARTIRDWDFYV